MTKISRIIFVTFLSSAFLGGIIAHATTYPAASCNETDVSAALARVSADGDIVSIPSGTCTWTSTLSYSQTYSLTIQGQTTCTGTPASSCTDNTVISDGVANNSAALYITTLSNKSLRITGISFTGGNQNNNDGSLRVSGQSTQVRIDHNHFDVLATALETDGIFGVIDHVVVDGANNSEFWRPLLTALQGQTTNCGSGCGNFSWNQPTGLGGPNFMFLEDSTINGVGQQGVATNDCFSGGKYVVRHNILNDTSTQGHTTGHAGDDRGCRAQESYLNTYPAISGGLTAFNAVDLESGGGVVWGNTVAANSYSNFITAHIKREDNQTYTQTPPPNGWGYCGTTVNGTGSAWDQSSSSPTGYACLDQLGRGQGDLLSGLFSSKCNITLNPSCNIFTGQWPRQTLEPVYVWGNTWSCTGGNCNGGFFSIYDPGIAQNRDVFMDVGASCSGSSCTTGVGTGTLAQRPANCTTNSTAYPAGNSPGVGYWATDTDTLYVCTATNTWTSFYTPYTYPHPLQGQGGPPGPPSDLVATPQ
jgi:hypothetical protein